MALFGCFLVALACGGNGPTGGAADPGHQGSAGNAEILVGEYGSLTGTTATFGRATHDGIMLAVEEINAAGGVKGRKIRVITEDDQSRPEEAATVVAKLINQDRVVALLGEVASSRTLAAAPKAQEARIPMITPSSTNPKVTQVGDYIFRVCYLDDFQGRALARFVYNSLGFRRAAILRDIRNDYSVGLSDYFKQEYEGLGGKIVGDHSYSEGDADFKAQLTAIKSTDAEVLFVPGYYTEIGQIASQARDLGLEQPLVGGDGWESPRLLEIGGDALNGSFYSNHLFPGDSDPAVANFLAAFNKRYGENPDALAALGYDATKMLAAAMARTTDLTPAQIRDELAATRNFRGVTGMITIDENRNPVKSIVMLEIKDGQMTLREKVAPF